MNSAGTEGLLYLEILSEFRRTDLNMSDNEVS